MQERNSFPVLTPQTYTPLDGGPLFFPKGKQDSALGLAAQVTPYTYGPPHVHAVPIFYGRPTASRPSSIFGLPTPGV